MKRDVAERQPHLAKLLAAGSLRIAAQLCLSRGQVAMLAVGLVGAVLLGNALRSGTVESQRRGLAAAALSAADGAAALPGEDVADAASPAGAARRATAVMDAALDRLAGEIDRINKQLERGGTAAAEPQDRVGEPQAPTAPDGLADNDAVAAGPGIARDVAAAGVSRQRGTVAPIPATAHGTAAPTQAKGHGTAAPR